MPMIKTCISLLLLESRNSVLTLALVLSEDWVYSFYYFFFFILPYNT